MRYLIILSLTVFLSTNLHSQNASNSQSYYNWFDSVIGLNNTNLLNGTDFRENYITFEDNDQYFKSREFSYGNIVFNGQPYYNVAMKYDIHDDELIVKLLDYKGYFAIKLAKEHIESFQINDNKFINSNTLGLNKASGSHLGIYEVLFAGKKISILKKHTKSKQERRNDRIAFTEFEYKERFLINFNGEIITINSKKDFIKILPNLKKNIDSFYRNKRFLIKSNYNRFLSELGSALNNELTKKE